jgi:hypothetical protein
MSLNSNQFIKNTFLPLVPSTGCMFWQKGIKKMASFFPSLCLTSMAQAIPTNRPTGSFRSVWNFFSFQVYLCQKQGLHHIAPFAPASLKWCYNLLLQPFNTVKFIHRDIVVQHWQPTFSYVERLNSIGNKRWFWIQKLKWKLFFKIKWKNVEHFVESMMCIYRSNLF